MNSKLIDQLKQLKPTSREEINAALEKVRAKPVGAVAFEADVLRSPQYAVHSRKFTAKA
jgi:hypothetical protein